jgi:hypothetical protein
MGPAQKAGLPGTACAPDLFARFRNLKQAPGAAQNAAIRSALGFEQPYDSPFIFGADSWLGVLWTHTANLDNIPQWNGGMPVIQVLAWWAIIGCKAAGLVLCALFAMVVWTAAFIGDAILQLANIPDGCERIPIQTCMADIMLKTWWGRITGDDVGYSTRISAYARDWNCPTLHVSAGEAIQAWLHNEIVQPDLYNYAKMNALCNVATDIIVNTQRYRVGIPETIELWRRDQIPTQAVKEFVRRVGVLDDDQVGHIKTISFDRPGIGQVIRRANLGLYDPLDRQNYGLDQDQDQLPKPGTLAPEWRAGIYDKELKDAWAEHWQPVDVQTAYALYRRTVAGLMPGNAQFGDVDLEAAIRFSAVMPIYRDHIKALVWEPLNRRQLKALYDDYILAEADLVQRMVATGLAPSDAQAQVADWAKLRPLYTRRLVGGTGPGGLMAEFAAGTMGTSEYLSELGQLGFNGAEQQIALAEARAVRERRTRGQLISWLHARYIKGEVLEPAAMAALTGFGLDGEDVGNLLRLWRIELEVMPKEPSVAELLDWQCKGIISEEDLVTRLAQMRYQSGDIANMIAVNDLKCANQRATQAGKYLQASDRKLTQAEAYWRKLLSTTERKFGTVKQRTRTRAGQLLSVLKSELEGAPPPAKSLVSRAKAYIAQEVANAAGQSQPTVSGGSVPAAQGTVPPAGGAQPAGTVAGGAAEPQAPPTTESVVTGATATEAASPPAGSPPPTYTPPGQTPYP